MAEVTIVYWRDIPAQVISGRGRRAFRIQLPERFEQAIDRCAMKAGLVGTDEYLSQWRKSDPVEIAGDASEVTADEAQRIDREYDTAHLKTLIENEGWAQT